MVTDTLIDKGIVRKSASVELEWAGAARSIVPHLGHRVQDLHELTHLKSTAKRERPTLDDIANALNDSLRSYFFPSRSSGATGERTWDKSLASRVMRGEEQLTVREFVAACRLQREDCFANDDAGLLAAVEDWLAPALHLHGSRKADKAAYECLEAAAEVARIVGDYMESRDDLKRVGVGAGRNKTIEADLVAHALANDEIRQRRQDDVILGEERDWRVERHKLEYKVGDASAALEDGQRAWMLDPIDGSILFARDLLWSVSIGVGTWNAERGDLEIDCAAIYAPKTKELYLAFAGGGTVLVDFSKNRVTILKPSSVIEVGNAAVGTHLSAQRENFKEVTSKFIHDALPDHSFEFERVLMWGVGSLSMCAVAAGRIESFLNVVTKYWDFCAARLIVECAGGIVTDANDKPLTVKSTSVLASANPTIHKHVARLQEKIRYLRTPL